MTECAAPAVATITEAEMLTMAETTLNALDKADYPIRIMIGGGKDSGKMSLINTMMIALHRINALTCTSKHSRIGELHTTLIRAHENLQFIFIDGLDYQTEEEIALLCTVLNGIDFDKPWPCVATDDRLGRAEFLAITEALPVNKTNYFHLLVWLIDPTPSEQLVSCEEPTQPEEWYCNERHSAFTAFKEVSKAVIATTQCVNQPTIVYTHGDKLRARPTSLLHFNLMEHALYSKKIMTNYTDAPADDSQRNYAIEWASMMLLLDLIGQVQPHLLVKK